METFKEFMLILSLVSMIFFIMSVITSVNFYIFGLSLISFSVWVLLKYNSKDTNSDDTK